MEREEENRKLIEVLSQLPQDRPVYAAKYAQDGRSAFIVVMPSVLVDGLRKDPDYDARLLKVSPIELPIFEGSLVHKCTAAAIEHQEKQKPKVVPS